MVCQIYNNTVHALYITILRLKIQFIRQRLSAMSYSRCRYPIATLDGFEGLSFVARETDFCSVLFFLEKKNRILFRTYYITTMDLNIYFGHFLFKSVVNAIFEFDRFNAIIFCMFKKIPTR